MYFNFDGFGFILLVAFAVLLTVLSSILKMCGFLLLPWVTIISIIPICVLFYVFFVGIDNIF